MNLAEPLRIACLALMSATLTTLAFADPIPAGARSENVEAVGYVDAPNASPFKMSLLESDGRWYMYTSNLFHRGWAIFDVTDPTDPTMVKFIDGPENTATWQLDLADAGPRAGAKPPDVVGYLHQADGHGLQRATALYNRVEGALCLEVVFSLLDLDAQRFRQPCAHPTCELRMGVDARTDRCTSQGHLRQMARGVPEPLDTALDLARVPLELLS